MTTSQHDNGSALRDKASEDLAYVRRALERQRRMICEAVPLWFAASVATTLALSAAGRDLVAAGLLEEVWRDRLSSTALLGLMVVYFGHATRRHGSACSRERMRAEWREARIFIWPWIVFIAGILFIKFAGDAAGLEKEALRPFLMGHVAVSMILIGLDRLSIVLGFGVGIAAGTLSMVFLDLPAPWTVFGLLAAIGLVAGARRDQRLFGSRAGA